MSKYISYINQNEMVKPNDIANYFGVSQRAVSKNLKKLLAQNKIVKYGKSPFVYYSISEPKIEYHYEINKEIKEYINNNFLFINMLGEKITGVNGFCEWCSQRKQDINKTAIEYFKTAKKYDKYKKNGLINGNNKLKNSFDSIYINDIFYCDFYSIERFGKTYLGQLLLYAKQSQNKALIKEITSKVKPAILDLIKKYNIQAVGFIPPSIIRKVQFMKEFKKYLNLNIKEIKIEKLKTEIIIPQKTLNKIEDRILNAKRTILINETAKYNNILLIDDNMGSGATLNETAKKLKLRGIANKVFAVCVTGSFKGFEVLNEV